MLSTLSGLAEKVASRLFVILVVVGITVAVIVLGCSYQLGMGEVAVVVDPLTKSVSGPVVGPCFGLKAPWQYLVKDFYTVDYIEMSGKPTADYPAIGALTKDGVSITVEMTFTYSIDPGKFDVLARNYPRIDYEEQRLVPMLRQIVRDVIAKYTVEEVITKRDSIAREIENAYRQAIASDETLAAIRLHQVNLRAIILPTTVQAAIEEKVASYQRKIAAEYEAERMITLARANATSRVIEAEAAKNATILQAEAYREALEMILNATGDVYAARLWMLRGLSGAQILIVITPANQTIPLILNPNP